MSPLIFWAIQLISGISVFFLYPILGNQALLVYLIPFALFVYFFTTKKQFVIPSAPFVQSTLLLHSTALFLPIITTSHGIRPLWDGFVQSIAANPYMIAPADVGPGIASSFSYHSYLINIFSASPFSPTQQILFKFGYLFSEQIGNNHALMVFKSAGLLILGIAVFSSYSRFTVQGRLSKLMLVFWNPVAILLISSQSDLAFLGSLITLWMIFLREDSTEDIRGAISSIAFLTYWPLALIGIRKEDATWKFGGIFLLTTVIFALLFGGYWGLLSFFGENIRFSDFWFYQETWIGNISVVFVLILTFLFSRKTEMSWVETAFVLFSSYFIVFTDASGIAWTSTMIFLVMREKIDELKTAIFSLIGILPIITRLL